MLQMLVDFRSVYIETEKFVFANTSTNTGTQQLQLTRILDVFLISRAGVNSVAL